MASYYNFGIELEMIVTPHKERDYENYQGSKERMRVYWLSYYERLAAAMRSRGLRAMSTPGPIAAARRV